MGVTGHGAAGISQGLTEVFDWRSGRTWGLFLGFAVAWGLAAGIVAAAVLILIEAIFGAVTPLAASGLAIFAFLIPLKIFAVFKLRKEWAMVPASASSPTNSGSAEPSWSWTLPLRTGADVLLFGLWVLLIAAIGFGILFIMYRALNLQTFTAVPLIIAATPAYFAIGYPRRLWHPALR